MTLTNSTIVNIVSRPEVQREFPEFVRIASGKRPGGCRCSKTVRTNHNKVVNEFKTLVRGWSAEKRNKLKQVLGAQQIQVYVGTTLLTF